MAIPKRNRYVVSVTGNGETKQVVIIANDLEGMYREIYRLYGSLLKDLNGNYTGGTISYKESTLN